MEHTLSVPPITLQAGNSGEYKHLTHLSSHLWQFCNKQWLVLFKVPRNSFSTDDPNGKSDTGLLFFSQSEGKTIYGIFQLDNFLFQRAVLGRPNTSQKKVALVCICISSLQSLLTNDCLEQSFFPLVHVNNGVKDHTWVEAARPLARRGNTTPAQCCNADLAFLCG